MYRAIIVLPLIWVLAVACKQTAPKDASLEQAKALARQYLGLSDSDARRVRSASAVTISSTDLPASIYARVGNAPAVRIDYDSVLMFDFLQERRNVSLLMSAGTGALLKVTVSGALRNAGQESSQNLDSIEQVLYERGMRFWGFPDSVRVAFLDIIRRCPYALDGGRLSAVYVIDSSTSGEKRARWVVAIPNHSPEPIVGVPGIPDSLLDRYPYTCSVVEFDGETGKLLRSGSF